jgi:hypothetical protein
MQKKISNKVLQTSIPKSSLDNILHYLLEKRKTNHNICINNQFVFQYYKNFQLLSRLRGSALCLLKTQYAKKPKNPV